MIKELEWEYPQGDLTVTSRRSCEWREAVQHEESQKWKLTLSESRAHWSCKAGGALWISEAIRRTWGRRVSEAVVGKQVVRLGSPGTGNKEDGQDCTLRCEKGEKREECHWSAHPAFWAKAEHQGQPPRSWFREAGSSCKTEASCWLPALLCHL